MPNSESTGLYDLVIPRELEYRQNIADCQVYSSSHWEQMSYSSFTLLPPSDCRAKCLSSSFCLNLPIILPFLSIKNFVGSTSLFPKNSFFLRHLSGTHKVDECSFPLHESWKTWERDIEVSAAKRLYLFITPGLLTKKSLEGKPKRQSPFP